MTKVLYVSPNGYLGGAERFVLTAVENHRNVKASILFYSEGEASALAQNAGLKSIFLGKKFKLTNPFLLVPAILKLRKIIKDERPDIVHSTMPYAHITVSLATLGMNMKKVWFQHGPVGGRLDQIANLFPVDMIFYNSLDLKERHHRTKPEPRVKRSEEIIHLGVKTSAPRTLSFNQQINLGTAGRICSWKGFHHIINALSLLKQYKWHLQIAGTAKTPGDLAYLQKLQSLVEENNLKERVTFLGHVAEMDNFFRSIDVFIHSSTIPEPFGLVVAEAMGHGCFVLGSNEGGVRDLLIDQKTGKSFASTTESATAELARKLEEVFNTDSTELQKLATNAQSMIKENYSTNRMIEELEKHYSALN